MPRPQSLKPWTRSTAATQQSSTSLTTTTVLVIASVCCGRGVPETGGSAVQSQWRLITVPQLYVLPVLTGQLLWIVLVLFSGVFFHKSQFAYTACWASSWFSLVRSSVYRCKWWPAKTRLRNDLLCFHKLAHSVKGSMYSFWTRPEIGLPSAARDKVY